MTRNTVIFRIVIPFVVTFGILLAFSPSNPKFPYEYKKGMPWKYETLVAQFDFPVLKTEEQIRAELSQKAPESIAYYKYSDEDVNNSLKRSENLSYGDVEGLRTAVTSEVRDILEKGVISDEGVKDSDRDLILSKDVIYIQKDKRAQKYPVSEIYRLSDARAKLLSELMTAYAGVNLDSLLRAAGAYELIVPNLIFDEQTTRLIQSENGREVSPTLGYAKTGQVLVSEGEMITAEIAQLLDSYKAEYNNSVGYSRAPVLFHLGNVLMMAFIVLLLFCVIQFNDPKIFQQTNKLLYLLLLLVISSVTTLLIERDSQQYLYLVPYTVIALFGLVFFGRRLSFSVYVVSLLPLLIFADSGVVLFCIFLAGGASTICFYRIFNRTWKQFVLSAISFLAMSSVYCGFRFLDMATGNSYMTILLLLFSALMPIALLPLTYVFERAFSLVSESRLAELSESSGKLLQQLERTAPGSFQHSLQLSNMVESVSREIGANALLARVGALYHDIGKMNNPQCFVENESLVNTESVSKYHDGLSPQQSAKDIIRHVTDGIELAEKNHIPEVVKAFILSHHGTSCVSFFYKKFLNEGGSPDEEAQFHYPGMKPKTKEQAILMICDSVEAASHTLKEHSQKSFSDLVENIVAGKLAEKQLDESDLTLSELETVKQLIKSYLAQMYHERVKYPKK